MSANIPTVRRIAWLYTVPHLLVMFGLILLLWTVQFRNNFNLAMLYGALGYLVYSFGSKALLLRHHRRGINLSKLGLFPEAISEFQLSYSFLGTCGSTNIALYRCLIQARSLTGKWRFAMSPFPMLRLTRTREPKSFIERRWRSFPKVTWRRVASSMLNRV